MKISLIAAITLDGFIARSSSEFASWTSKEDKKRFVEVTKNAGTIVLGSKTFNTFPKPLPGRNHIIYTRNPEAYSKILCEKFAWTELPAEIELTSNSVEELIEELSRKGIQELVVCGGSEIYTLFMEAGVIETLYLTIEPVLFGSGISLFNKGVTCPKLQLISETKTDLGTVFLEYKVLQA